MPTTLMSVSSFLYLQCTKYRWKLPEIAEGICTINEITSWEQGKDVPDGETARKIAKRLGVDEQSLLDAVEYDRQMLAKIRKAQRTGDYEVPEKFLLKWQNVRKTRSCAGDMLEKSL